MTFAPKRAAKVTLSQTTYPDARCLDGTQGAYYFSPGEGAGKRQFYVFREGGGFCSSTEECLARSASNLGSTSARFGWGPTKDLEAEGRHLGFSRDHRENPLMWNWNHVYVIYCDGMYYASSNMTASVGHTHELHFAGARIMHGVVADLQHEFGLSDATDVVIGGCSAGGISTVATIDWIRSLLQVNAPRASVAGLSCSGFFLNYNFASTRYADRKRFVLEQGNVAPQLSAECLAQNLGSPHLCLISEVAAPFTSTPLFLWDSLYDSFVLDNVLEERPCTAEACATRHGERVKAALTALWQAKMNFGGFLSNCVHHCEGARFGSVANMQPIDGKKPFQAMAEWYRTFVNPGGGVGQRMWVKDGPYNARSTSCPAIFGHGSVSTQPLKSEDVLE